MAQARVLVVDDEPAIVELLAELLADDGLSVDTADCAEDAWELIQGSRFDLLVTDKNLPGESGVDLVARVRHAGISLPSVLITGYPSIASVTEAFKHGVADYLAKPFAHVRHVLARLQLVLDRRISGLVSRRILGDMTRMVEDGSMDVATLTHIRQQLAKVKAALGYGVVLIAEPDSSLARAVQLAAKGTSASVVLTADAGAAAGRVLQATEPVAAVVDLDEVAGADVVRQLREADPLLEVLGVASKTGATRALAAITAGAGDFVLPMTEGLAPVGARLDRLVARSRSRRLLISLITTLYEHANDVDAELASAVLSLVSPEDGALVRQLAVEDLDIEDVPADELDRGLGEYLEQPRLTGQPLGHEPLIVVPALPGLTD